MEQANKPKKRLNQYLKYSGMGFELAAALLLGYLAGQQADRYFAFSKPFGTMACMMICLFAALFRILRNLMKENS